MTVTREVRMCAGSEDRGVAGVPHGGAPVTELSTSNTKHTLISFGLILDHFHSLQRSGVETPLSTDPWPHHTGMASNAAPAEGPLIFSPVAPFHHHTLSYSHLNRDISSTIKLPFLWSHLIVLHITY